MRRKQPGDSELGEWRIMKILCQFPSAAVQMTTARWLKTKEIYPVTVQEAGSTTSRGQQGHAPSENSSGGPLSASAAPGGSRSTSVYGRITPISVSNKHVSILPTVFLSSCHSGSPAPLQGRQPLGLRHTLNVRRFHGSILK